MEVDPAVLTVLLVVSGLVSAAVATLTWKERSRGGAGPLAFAELCIALWAFSQAVVVSTSSLDVALAAYAVTHVSGVLLGPAVILFAYQFTGNTDAMPRGLLPVLAVEVTVYVAVVATNPADLVFADGATVTSAGGQSFTISFGLAYYAQTLFTYALILAGCWLLIRKFLASRNVYRKRTAFILLYVLALQGCHVLSTVGLSPLPYHTLAPVANLVVGALTLLVFAGFRTYEFLPLSWALGPFETRSKNLAPVARERVIEEMRTGVIVTDHEDRIVDINPMGRRFIRRDDGRLIGKHVAEVFGPELFDDEQPDFVRDVTEGTLNAVWVTTPSGDRRCFDVMTTALDDDGGEASGHVSLVHDVTARERRKQTLEERTTELERQNERLDEFASVVSHDLRNPLSIAHAYVQTARDDGDLADLDQAIDSLEHMDGLIGDLLALARQGQTVDDVSECSLDDAARTAWRHVETGDATLDVATDATVVADDRRLQQLFENLFRNAVDHAGHQVAITVGRIDDGDGFYVADDGPGIPPDEREHVFDPGYSSSPDGTGLGLAIVRSIANAHGWSITATASAGGGARIEISDVTAGAGVPAVEPARPRDSR